MLFSFGGNIMKGPSKIFYCSRFQKPRKLEFHDGKSKKIQFQHKSSVDKTLSLMYDITI